MLTRAWYAAAAGACLLLWGAPAVLADDEPPATTEKAEKDAKPKDEPAKDDAKPAEAPKDEAAKEDDAAPTEKPGKAEIAWAKSYDAAVAQAKKEKKLVMVDVYTDWCGWCKKLDADTYTDPKVIRLSERYVPVKINAEEEGKDVAAKYKVRGFPTILFLNPDTKEDAPEVEATIGGYMPPGPFADRIRLIAEAHSDFPKFKQRHEDDPDDLEAVGKLAVIHHMRQQPKQAADLLEQGLKKDPENAKGQLTKALNAVADQHQEDQDFDEAIPLFRKAADTGKDPSDVAYARASIAVCLASQGKIKEAVPELEAIAKIPGVSKEDKDQATLLLKQLRQLQARAEAEKDDAEEKKPEAEKPDAEEKKPEAEKPEVKKPDADPGDEPKADDKKAEEPKDEPKADEKKDEPRR